MLEILALIFLTRNIGSLATQKGIKPGPWKLYTVLAWFAGEIAGGVLGMVLFEDILPAILVGIAFAIGSFFIVKSILAKKPESFDEEINRIGQPPLQES